MAAASGSAHNVESANPSTAFTALSNRMFLQVIFKYRRGANHWTTLFRLGHSFTYIQAVQCITCYAWAHSLDRCDCGTFNKNNGPINAPRLYQSLQVPTRNTIKRQKQTYYYAYKACRAIHRLSKYMKLTCFVLMLKGSFF